MILNAMAAHWKEKRIELLRWPWKLFCAEWAELLRDADEERKKQEAREREQTERRLEAVRARALAEAVG